MTIGLSRRSSVPALKLKPSRPTRFLPVSSTWSNACWICSRLLGEDRRMTGISRSTSLRAVLQRAHVLRQARAAEREPRLQVVRRQVQLLVAAEDVHHLVAVDAERLHRLPISLAKHDLQRVPGVARVLDHLRDADARADERRVDRLRTAPIVPLASAAWLWPTSVSGGLRKSLSAVPSRRNSGLTDTPKPSPYFLPDARSSAGIDHVVRRARQHGAADDDDVVGRSCPCSASPICSQTRSR